MRPLLALAMVLGACAAPAEAPGPSPSPLPAAELKYRVMDAAGPVWFCDPDLYPVARADERDLARQKMALIRADAPTYAAITARVGTDELAVYRDWKTLNALELRPVGDAFGFGYLARTSASGGERVEGRVSAAGRVAILSRTAAGPPTCPICLARGTRIATPAGEVAVEALRAGDLVWTIDGGVRVAGPLVAVGRTAVPAGHAVVRLTLGDGRVVVASPGHPTADGRRLGRLAPGDTLDGSTVISAARERYRGGATYDILPAGPTGAYWANGVRLGSTLR